MKKSESKEIVELMQTQFPKFSKITLCMVRNPQYGVDYSAAAKRLLNKQKPKVRKAPDKKKLTVRVSQSLYDELKAKAGDRSCQELIEKIISEAIGGENGSDSG